MASQVIYRCGITSIIVMFMFIQVSDCVRCKVCPYGVSIDGYCNKVGECSGDSVCYTSVTDEGFGFKKVVTGCMSRQVCRNYGIAVKRQSGTLICFDCCETDLCNSKLCGSSPPSGFRECYSCDSVSEPKVCDTSSLCTDDQYCMTEFRYAGAQSGTYRMGCENIEMCEKQEQFASYFNKRGVESDSSNPLQNVDYNQSLKTYGRRPEDQILDTADSDIRGENTVSSNAQISTGNVKSSKRYIDDPSVICLSCCKYPFCNNRENCYTNEKAPPPRTTVKP